MSKIQLIVLSLFGAVPATGLLYLLAMSGSEHGDNVFSGLMVAIWGMTFVLSLILLATPFLIMAWYPKEGFSAVMATQPQTGPQSGQTASQPADEMADDDEDLDGFDDGDDFEDDDFEEGSMEDDGFGDDDEFDEDDWE